MANRGCASNTPDAAHAEPHTLAARAEQHARTSDPHAAAHPRVERPYQLSARAEHDKYPST
eukprot:11657683-Alexandrium_andersonii.AAC.1